MTDSQTARRCLPLPVEASTWSNRKPLTPDEPSRKEQVAQDLPPICLEPESLLHTGTVLSSQTDRSDQTRPKKTRFAPLPGEGLCDSTSPDSTNPTTDSNSGIISAKPANRHFTPQVLDVSSRSRRANGEISSDHPYKTDVTPRQEPSAVVGENPILLPCQRLKDRSDRRSRFFRLPALETIDSSDSEPGLDADHTVASSAAEVPLSQTSERSRASIDHDIEQYLLGLESKRMQQRLEEQALAAYPNSDYHEPVEHYVDQENDTEEVYDDRPTTWDGHEDDLLSTRSFRRDDTLGVNWELMELRQYHEVQEQERNVMKTTAKRSSTRELSSAFGKSDSRKACQSELSQMRDSARPPMLGDEIVFPRSTSPEPARFDVTQGSHLMRSSTCYLTEQLEASARHLISPEGLWGGLSQPLRTESSQSGLWAGLCIDHADESQHSHEVDGMRACRKLSGGRENISIELGGSLSSQLDNTLKPHPSLISAARRQLSAPDLVQSSVAAREESVPTLSDEEANKRLNEEYPDDFITQVFNYLSLGYPSLARSFDTELSQVSQIPISELRLDDTLARSMPRGYIRLGPDFESDESGTAAAAASPSRPEFVRWRALKLYVYEWARAERQRTSAAGEGEGEGEGEHFGTAPRRGSWAW